MQPQEKANKISKIIDQLNLICDSLIDLNTDEDREFVDRQLINRLQCLIKTSDIYSSCLTKWRDELLKRAKRNESE